jgi:hypothetical protein
MVWQAAATIGASYWQNRQAKKRAREQMRFQEDMSNTSYQRVMDDMLKIQFHLLSLSFQESLVI